MAGFPLLFSLFELRGLTFRNRIFSTGHGTMLAEGGTAGPDLVAYHEARARGGAGLIVTEATLVHDSAIYDDGLMQVKNDDSQAGLRNLTGAVHRHGCRIFGQLFHPGREVLHAPDGIGPVAYSASATPNERFHVMPREMPADLIAEVVDAYGQGASACAGRAMTASR